MSSGDKPEPDTHTPSPYISPTESPAEATAKAIGAGILFGILFVLVLIIQLGEGKPDDKGRRD